LIILAIDFVIYIVLVAKSDINADYLASWFELVKQSFFLYSLMSVSLFLVTYYPTVMKYKKPKAKPAPAPVSVVEPEEVEEVEVVEVAQPVAVETAVAQPVVVEEAQPEVVEEVEPMVEDLSRPITEDTLIEALPMEDPAFDSDK
jgi:hypothetical protein